MVLPLLAAQATWWGMPRELGAAFLFLLATGNWELAAAFRATYLPHPLPDLPSPSSEAMRHSPPDRALNVKDLHEAGEEKWLLSNTPEG